jgi:hypothetical protein|tara:strand:+ start:16342 stop:16752 length:411 start_codon:yes stop_codon:yes gene_type:complete
MKISENTSVAMPVRNLISIIAAVALGVWGYFGIVERLNQVETEIQLMKSDLEKNTEFRIKWPRGEMGSLPADAEQFMLIEYTGKQLNQLAEDIKNLPKDRSQDLTINFFEDRILKLEDAVEDLKDKVRANGNGKYE